MVQRNVRKVDHHCGPMTRRLLQPAARVRPVNLQSRIAAVTSRFAARLMTGVISSAAALPQR